MYFQINVFFSLDSQWTATSFELWLQLCQATYRYC